MTPPPPPRYACPGCGSDLPPAPAESCPRCSLRLTGPAVTAALVASTVVARSDEGLARPLLALVAGALTVIIGVDRRWQAPVVAAGVCVAAVAVAQIGPYAAAAPRWLSLGALGVALLVAGATYEARVRDLRRAGAWVSGLE